MQNIVQLGEKYKNHSFSVVISLLLITITFPAAAQEDERSANIGRFSFFLTTRIMEDGSIQEGGLGWNYNDALSGDLRLRLSTTEKNEELEDVEDSLNAVKQKNFEVFLLPLEYAPLRTSSGRIRIGIGGYYYNEKLKEKGFFNMPELEYLNKERVNAYTNDFSLQTLGPVLDTEFSFRASRWFRASLSGGVVPVFITWADQRISMVPIYRYRQIQALSNGSAGCNGSTADYGHMIKDTFDFYKMRYK